MKQKTIRTFFFLFFFVFSNSFDQISSGRVRSVTKKPSSKYYRLYGATKTIKIDALDQETMPDYVVTLSDTKNGDPLCDGLLVTKDHILTTLKCHQKGVEYASIDGGTMTVELKKEMQKLEPLGLQFISYKLKTPTSKKTLEKVAYLVKLDEDSETNEAKKEKDFFVLGWKTPNMAMSLLNRETGRGRKRNRLALPTFEKWELDLWPHGKCEKYLDKQKLPSLLDVRCGDFPKEEANSKDKAPVIRPGAPFFSRVERGFLGMVIQVREEDKVLILAEASQVVGALYSSILKDKL